jgi:hypothetical protein
MKDTFVDTWGWYTLADGNEPQHEITAIIVDELADINCRLITTNFILDETYTLIRMRIHHHAAVEFHHLFNAMVDDRIATLVRACALSPTVCAELVCTRPAKIKSPANLPSVSASQAVEVAERQHVRLAWRRFCKDVVLMWWI